MSCRECSLMRRKCYVSTRESQVSRVGLDVSKAIRPVSDDEGHRMRRVDRVSCRVPMVSGRTRHRGTRETHVSCVKCHARWRIRRVSPCAWHRNGREEHPSCSERDRECGEYIVWRHACLVSSCESNERRRKGDVSPAERHASCFERNTSARECHASSREHDVCSYGHHMSSCEGHACYRRYLV